MWPSSTIQYEQHALHKNIQMESKERGILLVRGKKNGGFFSIKTLNFHL